MDGTIEGNPAIYNPALTRAQNLAITNQRRPMGTDYSSMPLIENIATQNYNALVLSAEKRASHGLAFLTGYRWSKCMDEIEVGWREFSSLNPRADYGRCGYDVTNQFRFSYNWTLPTPQSWGFVGKNIVGGWASNGILTLASGPPFTVWSGVDDSLSGIGLDRADLVGNPNVTSGRSRGQEVAEWFNKAAFTTNALGTFGEARDYPLLQGCILAIALSYVIVNLLTDFTYALVDPRDSLIMTAPFTSTLAITAPGGSIAHVERVSPAQLRGPHRSWADFVSISYRHPRAVDRSTRSRCAGFARPLARPERRPLDGH